jgi:hypothetical protein
MDVAFEDYRPAGVNRRRDAVWLRQQSARQQKEEVDDTGRTHHPAS